MNSKKVISFKNLPTRLPTTFTLVMVLFIKVFAITGIWLGVIITILALYWIACIIAIGMERHIDVFSPAAPRATKEDVEAMVDSIIRKLDQSTKGR